MVQHNTIDHTGIPGVGGSSGLVLLEQHTASASASLDFTSFISSTYDEYLLEGVALTPATDGTNLGMRVGTGGGPTYATTDYYGTMRHGAGAIASTPGTPNGGSSNGTTTQADAPGDRVMIAKVVNELDTGYGHASFSLRLCLPQSTAKMKPIFGTATWHDGTQVFMVMIGYLYGSTTALTAVRFLYSSGNIASGTVRAYGLAK